jgi:hypothetical protein
VAIADAVLVGRAGHETGQLDAVRGDVGLIVGPQLICRGDAVLDTAETDDVGVPLVAGEVLGGIDVDVADALGPGEERGNGRSFVWGGITLLGSLSVTLKK